MASIRGGCWVAESKSGVGLVAERLFRSKDEWHRRQARMPVRKKVRILLELQRQDLPLIARRRPLRPWERPWPIEP
jgi:hypothetical protein